MCSLGRRGRQGSCLGVCGHCTGRAGLAGRPRGSLSVDSSTPHPRSFSFGLELCEGKRVIALRAGQNTVFTVTRLRPAGPAGPTYTRAPD